MEWIQQRDKMREALAEAPALRAQAKAEVERLEPLARTAKAEVSALNQRQLAPAVDPHLEERLQLRQERAQVCARLMQIDAALGALPRPVSNRPGVAELTQKRLEANRLRNELDAAKNWHREVEATFKRLIKQNNHIVANQRALPGLTYWPERPIGSSRSSEGEIGSTAPKEGDASEGPIGSTTSEEGEGSRGSTWVDDTNAQAAVAEVMEGRELRPDPASAWAAEHGR